MKKRRNRSVAVGLIALFVSVAMFAVTILARYAFQNTEQYSVGWIKYFTYFPNSLVALIPIGLLVIAFFVMLYEASCTISYLRADPSHKSVQEMLEIIDYDFKQKRAFLYGAIVIAALYAVMQVITFIWGPGFRVSISPEESEGYTYTVETSEDLLSISAQFRGTVVLAADIDLNGAEIEGIGRFEGEFNGNGHTISDFSVKEAAGSSNGLFLDVFETVRDLYIKDFTVAKAERCGGITGTNYGTIENCAVLDGSVEGTSMAGAVTGSNSGSMIGCYVENCVITLTAEGVVGYTGGLSGSNGGSIVNSRSNAEIVARTNAGSDLYVGGLVGTNGNAIKNSYCVAEIQISSFTGETYIGGLCGQTDVQSEHTYEGGKCTECGYEASLWNGEAGYDFQSGTGTQEDPYVIADAEQFAFFSKTVQNVTFAGQYVRLDANIDLNGLEWMPVGGKSVFAGDFDGAGHTVSSFKITTPANLTGLFCDVSGSVHDLRIENFFIGYDIQDDSFLSSTTMACSGGLTGGASGAKLYNCAVENGRIFVTASMGSLYVGGLAGRIAGAAKINNVYVDVSVFGEQYGDGQEICSGGIIGESASGRTGAEINNSFSVGEAEAKTKGESGFTTNSSVRLGGIAGYVSSCVISGCATGCNLTISGRKMKKHLDIGSIVARKSKDFENCFCLDTQTFTKYKDELEFDNTNYSNQVTRMTAEGVKTQLQLFWDANLWSFDGETPRLRAFD